MRSFLLMVVIVCAVGCGTAQPELKSSPVKVSGKVSKAGQPLGNVAVSFHPLDHGHLTSVPVKPDGTFESELISGTYAYSIAASTAPESAQSLSKVASEYLEPDMQRTVKVDTGGELLIALD